MNLDTYANPEELYLARGSEVSPNRPVFTGDVFRDVEIPGVQEPGMALVVAHPCSFRVGGGELGERLLVARVEPSTKQGADAWRSRFFDRMPLTNLDGEGFWVGHLDRIGRSLSSDLHPSKRLACLSAFGINMLQQRLTCYFTRAVIPTATFDEAFSHTYEEAELLEDWIQTLVSAGCPHATAVAEFEMFIRQGDMSLQSKLLDPQQRSSVRRVCRNEASRLAEAPRG